jgi:hypothetical protein
MRAEVAPLCEIFNERLKKRREEKAENGSALQRKKRRETLNISRESERKCQ